MPFRIVEGDITKLHVDAIVNAANESLLGGGGVDGAIHRAAGPRLLEECRTLHGCKTGEAKVTLGYDLPAKYVIHTVGPIWRGGNYGEEDLLRSAYRNSLFSALEKNCESVAFPMISAGVYGYPKDQALDVAVSTIRAFLDEHEMDVTLVIFDRESFRFDGRLYSEISGFIRNTYDDGRGQRNLLFDMESAFEVDECICEERAEVRKEIRHAKSMMGASAMAAPIQMHLQDIGLKEALENLDESFSQALLRMIDARGMKDSDCYKKANIDRKLFSKIRSDVNYRPSKQTVLAFAVALELDLSETEAFLKKAGFALSHSNKADVIVEYFISHRNYDMYRINEALFAFDQNLLGA